MIQNQNLLARIVAFDLFDTKRLMIFFSQIISVALIGIQRRIQYCPNFAIFIEISSKMVLDSVK